MLSHRSIKKYILTSSDGKTRNEIDHIFTKEGDGIQLCLMSDYSEELTVILAIMLWLETDCQCINEQHNRVTSDHTTVILLVIVY
jgi:hypothetical protein